jgi:CHAT domain-containing protein
LAQGTLQQLPLLEANTIHVHGMGARTPCGIVKADGQWKLLGTEQGDGTVTWASGGIAGIGQFYYLPAEHGALPGTDEYFPAIVELLKQGSTKLLPTTAPKSRDLSPTNVIYDAGPAPYPSAEDISAPIFGSVRGYGKRQQRKAMHLPQLNVRVKAMDLRFIHQPIMVGHYEQDPIAGAEAIVDALTNGMLSQRYNMGMYAGPLGSAVVALRPQNDQELQRGSLFGAIVTGLGSLDDGLSATRLAEAVHTGVLRYLLHYADCKGITSAEISLCSLLLGYNSSANLSIDAAVESLIKGVISANRKYQEVTGQSLRVGSLEIVELYLDTAISATHALRKLALNLTKSGRSLEVQLELDAELKYGDGWRHRLDDSRVSGYWPRLIIGDDERRDDASAQDAYVANAGDSSDHGCCDNYASNVARPRTAIAERLRFVHIGQRARAEVIVKQRQPGLIEKLVERQIASKSYDKGFCRTLFQLLVPHEFKDAARQLERIVLVLDGYTANLPWELMLADETPLAARTEVVRQLASMRFRPQVRQTRRNLAFVVGNPSTEGFYAAFPSVKRPLMESAPEPADAKPGLVSLTQAESEATRVVETLRRYDFDVTRAIGPDQLALDVLNPLYKQPYRIVHIAAHGIYDLLHKDGRARSGVVLSDGLLITAAEIEAMESVPDLVFLNCCHLAKTDARSVAYNKLAYSVARELIEIGVRCVIAAGWPVDDNAAELFAESFYDTLLYDKLPFGKAVYAARRAVYEKYPSSMTWGAYQVYGDPGWRILPNGGLCGDVSGPGGYVAPEELIDKLNRVRVTMNKQGEVLNETDAKRTVDEVENVLKQCPAGWRENSRVLYPMARVYAELGADYFAKACDYYREGIVRSDKHDQVSLDAIEQLANLEARDGELRDDMKAVNTAIARLENLNRIVCSSDDPTGLPEGKGTTERLSILGSAYKSLAAIHAKKIVSEQKSGKAKAKKAYREAIKAGIAAYQQASRSGDCYPLLNFLVLQSLQGNHKDLVQDCENSAEKANAAYRKSPNFWDAMTAAEAELTKYLLLGSLEGSGASADACLDQLSQRYTASLEKIQVRPKDMDSVMRQLKLMTLFFTAEGEDNKAKQQVAIRLQRLIDSLQPYAGNSKTTAMDNTIEIEPVASDEPAPAPSGPIVDVPTPRARPRRTAGSPAPNVQATKRKTGAQTKRTGKGLRKKKSRST